MRHDYNFMRHDYTVKQHDYNDKRNDYKYSKCNRCYAVCIFKWHEYNVMWHYYIVKRNVGGGEDLANWEFIDHSSSSPLWSFTDRRPEIWKKERNKRKKECRVGRKNAGIDWLACVLALLNSGTHHLYMCSEKYAGFSCRGEGVGGAGNMVDWPPDVCLLWEVTLWVWGWGGGWVWRVIGTNMPKKQEKPLFRRSSLITLTLCSSLTLFCPPYPCPDISLLIPLL